VTHEELKTRLLRLLAREEAAGRRRLRDTHAQSIEERVEAGDCLADLHLIEDDGNRIVLGTRENLSRFREGDPARLGNGRDPSLGLAVSVVDDDPVEGLITLERDFAARGEPVGGTEPFVLDKRDLSSTDRLARAVARALDGGSPAGDVPFRIVSGGAPRAPGDAALRAARKLAAETDLDPSQREAFAAALAADPVHLIQGPPGSGKTWLLAELLRAFTSQGERVLVTAFTHRAINNVLRAFAPPGSAPPCPVVKIGRGPNGDLAGLPLLVRDRLRPGAILDGPLVVGATAFGAARLWDVLTFNRVVIDEAAQVPLPHGVIALGSARRATLVGDHRQMGPIVQADPPDPLASVSIFEHLYASYGATRLTTTYRMNADINAFPSRHFYDGALVPHPTAASRRLGLRPGGRLREILDPARPAVLVTLDHRACRQRSPAEAALAADLAIELMGHHGVPAREIAVIAPYRAQVNTIKQALRARAAQTGATLGEEPVIDTVERIQGQERDVIIASFTASDPDFLAHDASFYFSPNRLNVLLTRPRLKRILLAGHLAFHAIPRDLDDLLNASLFRRLYDESDRIAWGGA
jgi:DNA replication ATP-dependent helicase Dna2